MNSAFLLLHDPAAPHVGPLVPRNALIRTNRLLQVVPGLWDGIPRPTDLGGWDDETIRRICRAVKATGLTHLSHGPVFESGSHTPSFWPTYDLLDQPERFAAICRIVWEEGLWNIGMIGLEDAPNALRKYGRAGFIKHTAALIRTIHPYVSHVCLGVEANEWCAKFAGVPKTDPRAFWEAHDIGAAIYAASGRIMKLGVHWNKGYWGPPGDEARWWDSAEFCSWFADQIGTTGITDTALRQHIERIKPRIESRGRIYTMYEYEKNDLARSIQLGNIARGYGIGTANG